MESKRRCPVVVKKKVREKEKDMKKIEKTRNIYRLIYIFDYFMNERQTDHLS